MHNFYAMLSRMKYINRWALMRNTYTENISEHSLEVAMLAHALAVIGNKRFGKKLDADRAAVIAMFHDATEIITGDMPTPIKYLNKDIKGVYKDIEEQAADRLLSMLPQDLREEYVSIFFPLGRSAEREGQMNAGIRDTETVYRETDGGTDTDYLCRIVKAADKLSALIKCIEESKTENHEFDSAAKTLRKAVQDMELPEVGVFMEEFLPAYELTLDELNLRNG
ncbi:MAG: 5'-deoxynucleotidase [Lachnospiraceae bacterium]|nr:5'-deoxynucleotidase [Lachnospiraceae bacterium]